MNHDFLYKFLKILRLINGVEEEYKLIIPKKISDGMREIARMQERDVEDVYTTALGLFVHFFNNYENPVEEIIATRKDGFVEQVTNFI